jgi:hypothetical protein
MSQLAIVPVNTAANNQALRRIDALEATHAAAHASDRYGFVSTREIIDQLLGMGYQIRSVQLVNTRKPERQGFQAHYVRLNHNALVKVGDSFPEIVLRNSHDCSSSFLGMLGLFRLVCSNGMVSGNIEDAFRLVHRVANVSTIVESVMKLADRAGRMSEVVRRMTDRLVTSTETTDFILEAAKLRYEKPDEAQLFALRNIRRVEDSAPNAWTLFNRVQENLTKGGRGTGIRRITGATRDIDINRRLWTLAETAFLN